MLPLFSMCVCVCVYTSVFACFCVLLCTIYCYFLKMPQNKIDGICLQEAQNLWGEIYIFKDACSAAQSYLTLKLHGLQPARLLCSWDFPGKNNGVGCHFLLQGTFPTQDSNLCLLNFLRSQVNSLLLRYQGSPFGNYTNTYSLIVVINTSKESLKVQ